MSFLKKSILAAILAGIFISIFPWVFAYNGNISGVHISVRAVGDVVGVFCAIGGITLLVSKSFQEKALRLVQELDTLSIEEQNRLLHVAVGLYAIGIISHKLRAHYMIGTHAFDLGFFSNICWNTAHGNWFYSSLIERNFMAVHVNWILWPISFIYRFWSGSSVLLVAQALILTAALPVLWHTAWKLHRSFTVGLIAALLFVSSPYIGHTISNDFHPDVWLVPCLFLALSSWLDGEPFGVVFFSLLALLAKEDVSVVLVGFGIFLMLKSQWRPTGAVIGALAIAVFLFHTKHFIPHYIGGGQSSVLYDRYRFLGKNFSEMGSNLVHHPGMFVHAFLYEPTKFWRFACYFFPVAGLTVFVPSFLIPPIISVIPHILSQASTQLQLADIYSLPSQPFIFIGAALGAKRLLQHFGTQQKTRFAAVLIIIAGIGIFKSPKYFKSERNARVRAFYDLAHLVPPTASVAAQQNILPHFDARRFVQLFPMRLAMPGLQTKAMINPEYVICDRTGNALPWNKQDLIEAIAALEADRAYEKIFERENFLLFRRIKQEEPRWRPA